jgi:hypothetical protein
VVLFLIGRFAPRSCKAFARSPDPVSNSSTMFELFGGSRAREKTGDQSSRSVECSILHIGIPVHRLAKCLNKPLCTCCYLRTPDNVSSFTRAPYRTVRNHGHGLWTTAEFI